MIETQKYVRKPFEVDAVQVSSENMADVASWCKGEVITENGSVHVKVPVSRVLNERQTQAFAGDWVLHAGTGFKVYLAKAFKKSFDQVSSDVQIERTDDEKVQELRTVTADGGSARVS